MDSVENVKAWQRDKYWLNILAQWNLLDPGCSCPQSKGSLSSERAQSPDWEQIRISEIPMEEFRPQWES